MRNNNKHYPTLFGPPWTMNKEHGSSKFSIPLLLGSFIIAIGCHPSQTVDSVVIKKREYHKRLLQVLAPFAERFIGYHPGRTQNCSCSWTFVQPDLIFQQSEKINMIWFYYLESLLLRTIWTSVWEKKKWYWWFMIATCLKIRFGSLNAQNSW